RPRLTSAWRRFQLVGDGQVDVLAHRVPDRAVFLPGEGQRPLHLVEGDVTPDKEAQVDAQETPGVALRPPARELNVQAAQVLAPLRQDVDDVRGHAAGESQGQRLDGGGRTVAVPVEGDLELPHPAAEAQIALPGELELQRRPGLRHGWQAAKAPAGSMASLPSSIFVTLPSAPITKVTRLAWPSFSTP